MATNLETNINASASWIYTNDDGLTDRDTRDANSVAVIDQLINGTAADQADLLFHGRRTVNDAANDDLDLAGGLTDSFGNTLTFVSVRTIWVSNTNETDGDQLIVGGAANAFASFFGSATDTLTIAARGMLLLHNPEAAGYAVTAGTGDILRLTGSGANITYDIVIAGASA